MTAGEPDMLLRYWAVNMSMARASGQTYVPGFGYNAVEWERLETIAATVPRAAVFVWLAAAVVLYLVGAAVLVGFDLLVVASRLWPSPATAPEWGFFLLLASTGLVALSVLMPLSIAGGGWLADHVTGTRPPRGDEDDAALEAKVRHQFCRVAAVAAALMVPAALVFSWLGPTADVIVAWLRILSIVMALGTALFAALSRRYRGLATR
jgi:hypothetical protein